MMNQRDFFAELKRRNVYKVAVAYAIVGWLLVQIATQVFPFLEIPNWVVRLVIVLVAAGFPIALVIAWAFELTPEGIKRTEDVDLAASARQPRKRACRADAARSTSSVRLIPSGVSSNAQAMTRAIGNPAATNTITNRTTQFGISKNGKTCVA